MVTYVKREKQNYGRTKKKIILITHGYIDIIFKFIS